jgi:protein-disulfide isomerase
LEAGLRIGPKTSEFVLVEFTDYYCPYCATFAVSAMRDIVAGAPDLEVIVRNYPILEIHPKASALASKVECVADVAPESGWAVHHRLFARQAELAGLEPTEIDRLFDKPPAGLATCLSRSPEHSRVTKDRADAARLRLRGTPALILGRRLPADSVEGILLQGAYPAPEVLRLLDSLRSEGRVFSRVPRAPRESPKEGI